MLPLLEWCYEVGEVIIIDNNPNDCPKDELAKYNKIVYKPMATNLYCNMAFNIGVMLASNEVICLLNDDVIFDPRAFEFVAEQINESHGVLCVHPQYFNKPDKNDEMIKNLHLQVIEENVDGAAVIMVMLKKNYYRIPDKLMHHFGDEFLFRMQNKNGRKNYAIHNLMVMTPMRVTTALVPEVQGIIAEDWKIAPKVFADYQLENPIR
jgi:glycosyltransferase involved in cell wall biosynthesis